ncbi:MAG TPA: hypothetical protein VFZ27_13500 [Terriglobia bacterium]|nr:hypothetical protein [Terriglobia bacterium]
MGYKLTLTLILAAFGAVLFPLPSRAQGGFLRGGGQFVRSRPHVPLGHPRQGPILTGPRGRGRFRGRGSAVYPYLYPPYYDSGYYSETAPTEPEQERVVVLQNAQQPAAVAPAPPPKSLMLELRGDHWVRVTDAGQTVANLPPGEKGSANTESMRAITPQQGAAAEPAHQLPPAVLVFRDGHKEEISRYTIVGGNIYTSDDYWNSGSWTKKVPIAELDVPSTLQLNRERGTNFSLPSSPHVVVIRP